MNQYCHLREGGYCPKDAEEELDVSHNKVVKMRDDSYSIPQKNSKRKKKSLKKSRHPQEKSSCGKVRATNIAKIRKECK